MEGRAEEHPSAKVLKAPPELAGSTQHAFVRKLGGGGMGEVYLARNKLMDRLEVLKVVKKAYLQKAGAEDRFLREIRAAARLSHENVVKAYSADRVDGSLVFAMEFVEGEDLAKLVKEHGPLPISNACFYTYQAALGLQHACDQGIFHRDIKPSNLILARQGRKHVVKILDFGLAKAARVNEPEVELTAAGTILGTPAYMAPEQMQDAATIDIRADIYSLGCTLYYLLTGHPPFRGKSVFETMQAHHTKEAVPLDKACPGVSVELAGVVAKMMAKDPAKRYLKPIDAAQALAPFIKPATKASAVPDTMIGKQETIVRGRPASTFTGTKAKPRLTWRSVKAPWLIGGAAAAGVLLVSLVAMWASGVFTAKAKDGTVVLKDLPANADVFIDGNKTTVTRGEGRRDVQLSLPPGLHNLELKNKGVTFQSHEVRLPDGGNFIVAVRYDKVEPLPKASTEPSKTASVDPRPPVPADPALKAPPKLSSPQFFKTHDGFTSLFDGQDLSGWTVLPADSAQWNVKNGAIVGTGTHASFLLTQRGDFANFHFRIEAKISGEGNFGQCFRIQDGSDPLKSYEAHLTSLGPSFLRATNAEGVFEVAQTKVQPDTWFVQEVIAQGSRIQIFVSGKKTADFIDPKNAYAKGHLGIRLFDPNQDKSGKAYPSSVEVRRLEVKELTVVASSPPPNTKPQSAKLYPLEEMLKVQRVQLGPTNADTIKTMFSLVDLYSGAGRWDDAIAMCQEVVATRKAAYGEDSTLTWTAVSKLAHVYEDTGRMDESLATFKDLVKRETAKLGRDSAKTLDSDADLAHAYITANRLNDALALYQEAYKIAAKSKLGLEHGTTLSLRHGWGHVLLLQKKYAAAEPILRDVLRLREKKEPNKWQRYHAASLYGACLLGQKKFTEAETHLVKGYEGMKVREGSMTPPYINKRNLEDGIDWIIQLYSATGKTDQADVWRQKKAKTQPAAKAKTGS